MVDDLDVVAVGVQDEGSVVTRMVGALAGRTVVPSTCRQGGRVKAIDRRPIGSLEGEVKASGQLALAGARLARRDEELVAPEEVGPFDEWYTQDAEHCLIEAPARSEVPDDQVHMIEQSTSINSLGGHARSLDPVGRSAMARAMARMIGESK